ncbi:MAG: cohesin domain-containing protein [Bacillota bacterium]
MSQFLGFFAKILKEFQGLSQTNTYNVLILLAGLLAALCLAVPAWASETTVGPVAPENVVVGQEFDVNVAVYDVEGLAGCDFRLNFNPDVLEEVKIIRKGVFADSCGRT